MEKQNKNSSQPIAVHQIVTVTPVVCKNCNSNNVRRDQKNEMDD
jgi:hypothetical protein